MTAEQLTYLIFGIVLALALAFDWGIFNRRAQVISMKAALLQTVFWVGLALCFFAFVWWEDGRINAVSYLSAYLMEWSLSVDNIFVFVLIFGFFQVKEKYLGRVLLIGILLAIALRVIFITVGVALVQRFHWTLYIFGVFLVYTGIKMFRQKDEKGFRPEDNALYKFMKKYLRLTSEDPHGRFIIRKNNKAYFTTLSVVVAILAATDLVFALDSIPAVFAISQDPMVIYTSNIFAVLGLRSLFFLLRDAVKRFGYLQYGIAAVLVFIGLKMLAEIFHIIVPVYVSLVVIVICLSAAVLLSLRQRQQPD